MKLGNHFLASLVAGTSLVAGDAAAAATAPVHTAEGQVVGTEAGGVTSYKGIPFAAPPVGALRWRPPQPAAVRAAVLAADHYAPDCMQEPFPSDYAPLGTRPAEDCLYLNIWRPAGAQPRLPVMVWIYGGGFVNGGASPPTYSGEALARRGIVVVSFNYRLGRFGTFAHPALRKETRPGAPVANFGYMDQIAALKWVRRNVAAFGGDPAKVTVVGESAGGMSINTLLTSPRVHRLFQRAVIQSGGPAPRANDGLADAEAAGIAFARAHGITGADAAAATALRALDPAAVTDGLNMAALFKPAPGPQTFSSPIVDGRLAVDATAAFRAGRFARMPVMVGATSDDIGGPAGFMVRGARAVVGAFSAAGAPAFYYRFGYVASGSRGAFPHGAGHATEIPFFLNTETARYGNVTSADDHRAAELASGYLVNFVKTGDPNVGALPAWPRYSADRPAMMTFRADATAATEADHADPLPLGK